MLWVLNWSYGLLNLEHNAASIINGPCREETALQDIRPGKIQTSLLSYRD